MHPYSNERSSVTSYFPCVLPQDYYTPVRNQSNQQSKFQLIPSQQNQDYNYSNTHSNFNPMSVNTNVNSNPIIQQEPNAQRRTIVDSYNMSIPQFIPQNCPFGLHYLSTINQLFVFPQKSEVNQAIFNFEKINKYAMMNNDGQKIYYAVEENDCCVRNICGSLREFEIKIVDIHDNELIHLSRRYACQSCFFPCCLQKIEIFSPPGCLVGTVEQDWSILATMFTVRNEINEEVLKIKGPIGRHRTRDSDVEFKIVSKHETTGVGHISKQLPERLKETIVSVNTDNPAFGMTFPMDLDIRIKAVIIGASFLINFMFFENKNKT